MRGYVGASIVRLCRIGGLATFSIMGQTSGKRWSSESLSCSICAISRPRKVVCQQAKPRDIASNEWKIGYGDFA